MKALVEGGEIIEALRDRILGRVCIGDIVHPDTQEVIVTNDTLLDEDHVDQIVALGIDEVKVRTVLSCLTVHLHCTVSVFRLSSQC